MATTSTLYEDVVKNGYGKLLASTYLTVPTVYVTFLVALEAQYETFMFDIVGIGNTVEGSRLVLQVSSNNGASWVAGSYGWSAAQTYSHAAASYPSSLVLGTPYSDTLWLSTGAVLNYGINGQIYFNRGDVTSGTGVRMFKWHTTGYHTSQGQACFFGGGSTSVTGVINGVRFALHPLGNFHTLGVIRLYGLRTGAVI